MTTPRITTGATLWMALAAPAAQAAASYAALAFVRIRGVRQVGDLDEQWDVSVTELANRELPLVSKLRKQLPALTLEVYPLRSGDAGQALLVQAKDQEAPASFMLTQPDSSTMYFAAQVTGRRRGGLSSGQLATQHFGLQLTAHPIEA